MAEKKDPMTEMFEQIGWVLREAGRVIREAAGIGANFDVTHLVRIVRLGGYIGTSIALGVLGGLWLDSELGTNPLFILIGLALGIAVAVFGTYWRLRPYMHKNIHHKKDKPKKEE